MKTQRKKGFTMVELVIVIAVIAILAAVLIPTFVNLTKKANEAAALADARNIANQILADMLKGGGKDILVFEQKGDELYIHGYCAEAGRVLAYYGNPVKVEGDGTLADKVAAQLNTMVANGEVVPVEKPERGVWWHADEMAKATVELGYSAETTVLRADYKIMPVNFTKDEVPEEHTCSADTLTHYKGQEPNCTQAGYEEYWICNKCGKMYGTGDATGGPLTKINVIPPTGHAYVNGVCSGCGAKEPSNGGNNGGNANPTPAPTPTETAEPTEPSSEPEQTEKEKLIATVNEMLANYAKSNGGIPKTMHDAMTAIGTYKTQVQAAGLLWDSVKNEFCTEDEVTARLEDTTRKKYEFWKITSQSLDSGYSNYLAEGYTGNKSITALRTGLDVGDNSGISVTYSPYTALINENVIIRTDGGTLNVDKGTITHYGVVDTVTVGRMSAANSVTYTENGKVTGLLNVCGKSSAKINVTISGTESVARAVVVRYSKAVVNGNGKTPICYTTSTKPSGISGDGNGNDIGKVSYTGLTLFAEGFGTAAHPFVVKTAVDWSNVYKVDKCDSQYFKLGGNFTVETLLTTIGENTAVVLDLNGHTITLKDDATIQVGSKGLTIKDSGSNGGITKSETGGTRGLFISFKASAKVTIESGTFNGNYLVGRNASAETAIAITVKGGTFKLSDGFMTTDLKKATLSIQGGTFNLDPTTYLAEGYKATNSNGTWSVVPKN